MATTAVIVGTSGTGKSTSIFENTVLGIRGLPSNETVFVNPCNKELPFKGWKKVYNETLKVTNGGNYSSVVKGTDVINLINYVSSSRLDIKYLVIDDGQYIMTNTYITRCKEKDYYAKYVDIGLDMVNMMKAVREAREDLIIFFTWHPEQTEEGVTQMKSVGKMITKYLTLEGLFTIILYSEAVPTIDGRMAYRFFTNRTPQLPAKSPFGMFEDISIPNDLAIVVDAIKAYEE